jgi:hypothetical protein
MKSPRYQIVISFEIKVRNCKSKIEMGKLGPIPPRRYWWWDQMPMSKQPLHVTCIILLIDAILIIMFALNLKGIQVNVNNEHHNKVIRTSDSGTQWEEPLDDLSSSLHIYEAESNSTHKNNNVLEQ